MNRAAAFGLSPRCDLVQEWQSGIGGTPHLPVPRFNYGTARDACIAPFRRRLPVGIDVYRQHRLGEVRHGCRG
jgi:hypothetical protein